MQIFKQTFLIAVITLLTQIISSAQNWVLPSGVVTDAAPNNLIGIQGAGDKPLKISADNKSQIQIYTGTPNTQKMVIAVDGKVGIGTPTPTSILHLASYDAAYIQLSRLCGQYGPCYGSSGLKFAEGAIIYQSSFPAYGNMTLNIENGPLKIAMGASSINFGGLVGENNIAGKYNFNDLVWANTMIISEYATKASSLIAMPKGCKFAVNGKSNLLGNVSIGAIDTIAPNLLNISSVGGDQFIQFVRKPDGTPSGINGKSGIVLSNGAKITQSSFPNYGTGALDIENGTAKISLYDGAVNFGGIIGAGNTGGKFNFNNLTWATSLVVSDFGSPAPGSFKQIPTDYKFAVNGKSNFLDNVVIGNTADFTKGFDKKGYKLLVSDGIMSEKFKCAIKTTDNWSDFVFAPGYKLISLDSVGNFINKNRHLPGIPSANEVVENGLDLAVMDAKLLQKIEELTLYVLELKKENELMRKEFLKK